MKFVQEKKKKKLRVCYISILYILNRIEHYNIFKKKNHVNFINIYLFKKIQNMVYKKSIFLYVNMKFE